MLNYMNFIKNLFQKKPVTVASITSGFAAQVEQLNALATAKGAEQETLSNQIADLQMDAMAAHNEQEAALKMSYKLAEFTA